MRYRYLIPILWCFFVLQSFSLAPSISVSGTLVETTITYGASLGSQSFTVSASGLQESITVTAPSGFEVSSDHENYSTTLVLGDANFTGPASIYVRLAPTTNAGSYTGDIILSSPGAAGIHVNIPKSTVTPLPLTIYGHFPKKYGQELKSQVFYATTPGFDPTLPGLVNGNTLKSIRFIFGSAGQSSTPVGSYYGSITASDFEGENGYLPGNYQVTYDVRQSLITVEKAPLTIRANDVNKPFGTRLPDNPNSTDFTATGLQNNETVGYVKLFYGFGGAGLAQVGPYPGSVTPTSAGGGTFSPANYDISYQPGNLTVTPPLPVLTNAGQPTVVQTTYGIASPAASTLISGNYLTGVVTVKAPAGFEISTDNSNFNTSLQFSPDGSGTISGVGLYIRLTDLTAAGQYNRSVTLTTPGAASVLNIAITGTVTPAPLTITAGNIIKPFGLTLTTEAGSSNFTVTGLKNQETVGQVTLTFGNGAESAAVPGTYAASVTPAAAGGGSFLPGNYMIIYNSGNLIVSPPSPSISYSGQFTALQTIYGMSSSTVTLSVTGSYLTGDITLYPPTGFEIGTDNRAFSPAISIFLNKNGPLTVATAYIRLSATTAAGLYQGSLTVSSPDAANVSIPLTGTVVPAPLSITAQPDSKVYGTALNSTSSSNFTVSDLQNEETVSTISLNYGPGAAATDDAGVYNTSIEPSSATGSSFNPANYHISYKPAVLTVIPAALTIIADNQTRGFAKPDPVFTVHYNGFLNNDSPAQLISLPVVSTSATFTSPPGRYLLNAGNAQSNNYNITYVPGELAIYADAQNIKIPNVFTPNGDGINDHWEINDLQYYSNCTVRVFNRSGNQIFFSKGYGQAWDGTYHNQHVPAGVYYYLILTDDATPVRLSGPITIIR